MKTMESKLNHELTKRCNNVNDCTVWLVRFRLGTRKKKFLGVLKHCP